MEIKQKWMMDGGVFYPIPGNTTLHITPGTGVFQIHEQNSMSGTRLGLVRLADSFEFNFKIYDLGIEDIMEKIEKTWNSDVFVESNRNLGVIFNGLKGTGKTIGAKILSNRMGIPVILVNAPYNGLLDFIQSLCFECIVLIDEAEKTFEKKGEVLLKMIDGVYNERRKLYLLTTNNLYLDPNLLGRPGRIRYIKQFGNLAPNAINEYIKDNLVDKSKADAVLKAVDTLEISTIDILKSIIDEVNIHGDITEHSMLNIPKARYKIDVVRFHYLGKDKFGELKEFLKTKMPVGMTMKVWLNKEWRVNEDNERETNEEMIEEMFNMSCWTNQLASSTQYLVKGQQTFYGEVIEEVDENGFFVVHDNSTDEEELCRVLNYHNAPSLYRGALSSFIY